MPRSMSRMRHVFRVGSRRLTEGAAQLGLVTAVMIIATGVSSAQVGSGILQATLDEPDQKTAEVSTEELRRLLADGSAIVLDSRKHSEYVTGHIPGALSVAPEPDTVPEAYVSEVERLVDGDKTRAVVLYCNGPFCQASRRLGDQLVTAGFTSVRGYQIGYPIWRALGGTTEMDIAAIRRIYELDKTAVFLDSRPVDEFLAGSVTGARNIPPDSLDDGVLRKGVGDAALSSDDFNSRIVVFGSDAVQARALANALTRAARQNVAYFPGTFEHLVLGMQ